MKKNDDGEATLFDYAEGQRLRDEGMDRSYSNASSVWAEGARAALRHLAFTRERFTADAFWAELPHFVDIEICARTNRSAAGAIFTHAARNGLIERTSDFQNSSRPVAHVKPLPIWRSLVYRGLKAG